MFTTVFLARYDNRKHEGKKSTNYVAVEKEFFTRDQNGAWLVTDCSQKMVKQSIFLVNTY
jgi:hypothetical protein